MSKIINGYFLHFKKFNPLLHSRSVRVVATNAPVSHEHAGIGRRLYLGRDWSDDHFNLMPSASSCHSENHEPQMDELNGLFAAHFTRHLRSSLSLRLRKDDLQGDFDISLRIRTYDQDGLIFASVVNRQEYFD